MLTIIESKWRVYTYCTILSIFCGFEIFKTNCKGKENEEQIDCHFTDGSPDMIRDTGNLDGINRQQNHGTS